MIPRFGFKSEQRSWLYTNLWCGDAFVQFIRESSVGRSRVANMLQSSAHTWSRYLFVNTISPHPCCLSPWSGPRDGGSVIGISLSVRALKIAGQTAWQTCRAWAWSQISLELRLWWNEHCSCASKFIKSSPISFTITRLLHMVYCVWRSSSVLNSPSMNMMCGRSRAGVWNVSVYLESTK